MSKLIIIRGNSGSGKSTLAETLQHRFGRNTMVISQDLIRIQMLWVKDGEGTPALPLMIELLKYGRKNSEVVILEGILDAEVYYDLFETAKAEFGENIFAYYYDLPFEETVNRHQTRAKLHSFGVEDMKRWWNEKDFLKNIHEEIFTQEITLEQAADLVYNNTNTH